MKRTLSRRHEEEIAKMYGTDLTIGSGNKYEKLDSQSDIFFIENKCTTGKGWRFDLKTFEEVEKRTYEKSETARPLLALRFYGEEKTIDTTEVKRDFVILDMNDHLEELHRKEQVVNVAYGLVSKLEIAKSRLREAGLDDQI